eukprot:1160565-Pelagomonas_calceolata.AAC.1
MALYMAALDAQFMKLPGWSCAASYFFITSHTAEYPMARTDQDSIRTAEGASSMTKITGVTNGFHYLQMYVGSETLSISIKEKGPWMIQNKKSSCSLAMNMAFVAKLSTKVKCLQAWTRVELRACVLGCNHYAFNKSGAACTCALA